MHMAKLGAKPKYKEEYLLSVRYMAKAGLTEVEIAKQLGIVESTWHLWKKKYPELQTALEWKDEPNGRVAKSVFDRANGYQYQEIVQEPPTEKEIADFKKLGQEPPELITRKVLIKHMPADPTSAIFYLKNRDPKNWKDKQEIEHSGGVEIGVMTKQERAQRISELLEKRNANNS